MLFCYHFMFMKITALLLLYNCHIFILMDVGNNYKTILKSKCYTLAFHTLSRSFDDLCASY